jgi:hypothetical protein
MAELAAELSITKIRLIAAETQRQDALARLEAARAENAVLRDAASSNTGVVDPESRLAKAEQELAAVRESLRVAEDRLQSAANQGSRPDSNPQGSVVLQAGKVMVPNAKQIHPTLLVSIKKAAARVYLDPDASVAESRRALERAIWMLLDSVGRRNESQVSEALEALHGSPAMPIRDWHLSKNLWGRASALTHEGSADEFVALWICLGTILICQLVPKD